MSRARGRWGGGERGATRKPVSSPRARVVLPVACCSVLLIAGCGSAGDPGGRTAEPSPGGHGGRAGASSPGCQVIMRG
ncbi:MAG: hypothetical protein ACTHPS_31215, partial [Streptosporangiaceae bacterium]